MPLAADELKLAPPARAVLDNALAQFPTVRTVAGLSTRKSVGNADNEVAVAGMPMPSNVWVYAGPVGNEIAANTPRVAVANNIKVAPKAGTRPRIIMGFPVWGISALRDDQVAEFYRKAVTVV
jgi:hypothetical protein